MAKKRGVKPRKMLLRHYWREMAFREHICSRCQWTIYPGERYYADVWAIRGSYGSRIYVEKFHDYECDYDPRDDEDYLKDDGDVELPKAA